MSRINTETVWVGIFCFDWFASEGVECCLQVCAVEISFKFNEQFLIDLWDIHVHVHVHVLFARKCMSTLLGSHLAVLFP